MHGEIILIESLISPRNPSSFVEPEVSKRCLQYPATSRCPEVSNLLRIRLYIIQSVIPIRIWYTRTFLSSPMRATYLGHLTLLNFIIQIVCKLWSSVKNCKLK
jgi:hypothetical protein